MGFYQPAQIVIDARKHGVEVRPVDINYSNWDNILEERTGKYCPLRLGFRQVKGLREEEMQLLVVARKQPFSNIHSLRDAGISEAALERLADADAFRSIGLDRRQALWEVAALSDRPAGLFTGQPSATATEPEVQLPNMTPSEHVIQDYISTSLSLKAHPVSFVREKLRKRQVLSTAVLNQWPNGTSVRVAGLVLVRQRPGTASGICFITIEDETGTANLVAFQHLFNKYRKEILRSSLLMVEGTLQREGEVTHVIIQHCHDMSGLLAEPGSSEDRTPVLTLSRADEKDGDILSPQQKKQALRKPVQGELFPSRDFK